MSRHRARDAAVRKATSAPDLTALSSTVRRGAVISAFTLGIVQIVSLVQTLVLARLLSPEEIGLFVAGSVLSGFLISFSEGGLRAALIQREESVEDAADTVFWATAGTGLVLSLAALAVSPIIGRVFQDSTAGVIAAASSGTLLLHALTNVPDGLMQRQFNFKRRLIVDPSRVIGYAIVTITLAAAGFGVWALVIGNYVGILIWVVTTWWLSKWRPGIGKPSYRLWREMARFAFPLLIEGLVERVRTAAEITLVGRTLQAETLGQYRYAQRLSMIPALAVVQIGCYVLLPAFSRLADKPERLTRAFLRALQWIWIAAVPVAGLLVAIGEPAVVVLLGERWRDAGVALMAMSGYGLGIALQAAGSEVIKGSGRSQLLNWTTGTSLVLGIGLLFALLPFGLLGVGLAISITELAIGIVVLVLVHRIIPFPVSRMAWLLIPPAAAAGVAMVLIGLLDRRIVRADEHDTILGFGLLGAESLAFLLVYLAVLFLLVPSLARTVIAAARSRLSGRGGADEVDDGAEGRDFSDEATAVFPMLISVEDSVVLAPVMRRPVAPPPRAPSPRSRPAQPTPQPMNGNDRPGAGQAPRSTSHGPRNTPVSAPSGTPPDGNGARPSPSPRVGPKPPPIDESTTVAVRPVLPGAGDAPRPAPRAPQNGPARPPSPVRRPPPNQAPSSRGTRPASPQPPPSPSQGEGRGDVSDPQQSAPPSHL